jgi:hypothetical protein
LGYGDHQALPFTMSEMIRRINAMHKARVHGNSLAEVSLKMKADGGRPRVCGRHSQDDR